MKSINLAAGILLIVNRWPAFALALLLPVTVIIIWFQTYFNPLPVPVATVVVTGAGPSPWTQSRAPACPSPSTMPCLLAAGSRPL